MIVVNLSAQTEVSDLLGGFKPVGAEQLADEIMSDGETIAKEVLD